ncbi:TrmB family transcriptional regulator [Brevibacillus borstelensis]|uniref:ECF-type sigma factor negative effector n=1 Tax=Brevibacillus borstelensis AK1 TaxID=1300222 RepID=M8DJP7_9BACL|nr:helix-turn-helix domain-containing protein [Brevibacillus borstelensis]EMT53662.1 ECF-type sigma factor negative effector [Brevibacillus borstelensis AK1]MCC0562666.1 TrmB family transcriptional regulator [Brevibacillus borstelensis]MCM3469726.1 TrmB family transcriptional regulator [Brevibacillus borstelensis]
MEEIYRELQKLNFSLYECKAYVGLLQGSPVTGYELSKRTGVPRSMIYEVLGKLLDREAVHTVPSDPVKYAPVPAKELIGRLRKGMEETLDYLEQALESVGNTTEMDVIWHIRGKQAVLNEMLAVMERSKQECWLSVWEQQYEALLPCVQTLLKRGVSVYSILFGSEDKRLGSTFHHNYMPPEVVEERMGGRLTIAARDGEEVVIAHFSEKGVAWAVKTTDPALVQVAVEYIRHDIMIEELTREFGSEKLEKLWRSNRILSEVVTGKRFMEE